MNLSRTNLLRNLQVAALDPLNADALFLDLPHLNDAANTGQLIQSTSDLLPSSEALRSMSDLDMLAVLRDLGMLASSIRKHGLEPREHVNGLERILLQCGAKTKTAPRDTVFTYGPQNPVGQRQRKFTTVPQEELFIASFMEGMSQLDLAIELLLQTWKLSITDPAFALQCERSLEAFKLMKTAIVSVRRHITPETFTFELRPYFEPYRVGEKALAAPGGAQMPLLLIDQLLWGSSCEVPTYTRYLAENIFYTPAPYQELSETLIGQPTLVQRVSQEAMNEPSSLTTRNSLWALRAYLTEIRDFRTVHLAVANSNFKLREGEDLGSGGYRPDILYFMQDKTKEALHVLHKLTEA